MLLMRKAVLVFIGIAALCLSACQAANRVAASGSANLENYNYVTLADNEVQVGPVSLPGLGDEICEIMLSKGFQAVDGEQIGSLSDEMKKQLLVVRLTGSQQSQETVVNVDFVDYLSGKTVAFCRGACGEEWTKHREIRLAANNALDQIKRLR
jgi:hypothetical protein